jgi:hypothetical protein
MSCKSSSANDAPLMLSTGELTMPNGSAPPARVVAMDLEQVAVTENFWPAR